MKNAPKNNVGGSIFKDVEKTIFLYNFQNC